MKRILFLLLLLVGFATAAQAQSGCVELREIDGTPDVKCVKIIRVTNGTLSCTGTTCTITISGGGGSGTVTSVAQSFTGGLISVGGSPITTSGTLALTVAGTSGGVPYFSSGSTWASSAALAANAIVIGGGAGAAPSTTTTGTGVLTALGVNVGSAGAFVVFNGAGGTPSSLNLTNATGLPLSTGVTGDLPFANFVQAGSAGFVGATGAGDYSHRTPAQVTAALDAFVGDSGSGGTKGLVPAPASGDAAANKYLKADGTWATVSGGGGGTPGGANTQVQYNNAGSFGGAAGFTFNGTSTISLGVAGSSVGAIGFRNATSGTITLQPVTGALGTVTLSLPAVTDTLVGKATTDILSNKTLASPAVTGNISAEATSLLFFGGNYYRYINGTGPATYDVTTDMVLTFNVQSLTDNRTVTWPDTALTVAGVNVANSWADGIKQTFNPDATTAGFNVGSVAGDPSAPANGDCWYDSTANEFTCRINGANVALGSGGGGSPPFADNTALVMNNADNTKRIQFSAASISASTTRVITVPDTNGTLVYEANTATLTNKTLSNVVLAGDTTVSGDAIFGPGTRIGTEASSTNTLLMSAYDVDGGVYVDFLRFTANNTPTLEVLQSLSWADGVRQTFNPNGTNAGLNVGSQAGAPTSLSNGDIWYDSTANKFKCRENGSTVDCIGSGGGGGLGDPGANGIVVRTALNTTTARTLTAGSSAGLTVTNGNGVSGDPTVDFATVNTSGLGFNLPGLGGTVFTYDNPSALAGSANEVRVVLFYAPMRITVDRVALNGVTNSASNNAGVGIYSADGNTKICDSGAISTASWSGAANYALSSSCTFGPGFYYYAWTADSTTPTVRSAGSITNYYNPLNNGSGTVLGTAANASSGGVLPSTLGALTDSAGLAVPIVRFYKN